MFCDHSKSERLDFVDRLGQSQDGNVPGSVMTYLEHALDESAIHLNSGRHGRHLRIVGAVKAGRHCGLPLRKYVVSARQQTSLVNE